MSKNIYKIGIDVATNKTGIGVFANDQVIYAKTIVSKEDGGYFRGDKVSQDSINIQNEIGKIVMVIDSHLRKAAVAVGVKAEEKLEAARREAKLIIAIEVSNHANKGLAQKLGVYAGVYSAILAIQFTHIGFSFIRGNFALKFVNPNEWKLRAFGTISDRELGKTAGIVYANKKFFNGEEKLKIENIGKGHDDIADALIIGSLAAVLRDNFVVGQQRHIRKNTEERNKTKIATLTTKANDLYNKLLEKKQKEIARVNGLKKWVVEPSKYKTKEAFFRRQEAIKESKEKAIKDIDKTLWEYANAAQKERILNYEKELKKLKADLDTINKFEIKGEIND